ncbi:MAG: pyruvate, phosphate dikinase [Bacilli bacterium]
MKKYVYMFNEGNKNLRNLLGGKGANLAEMTNIGLPVPSGFTVSTDACIKFYDDKKVLNSRIRHQISLCIKQLEKSSGKTFGNANNPLLLSVRSGARISMPGMMDTILNLGLNDQIVHTYSKMYEDPRFIFDSYRRLIQMYGDVVKGYDKSLFENIITNVKKNRNIINDTDLTIKDLVLIIDKFKLIYIKNNSIFPQDINKQLYTSIEAVFLSWNNDRAQYYRKLNNISHQWGTAVNVQEMVYGNLNNISLTGVAFTRNPSNGDKKLFGEYLINAQGEDVVAGVRTPEDINNLKTFMPKVYDEFIKYCNILENHYKDMQDMEFTVENGKLFILQTRNGKRTASAALKIVCDLVNEKIITKTQAIMRITKTDIEQVLHPLFDEEEIKNATIIAKGLPASPGASYGKIYFNAKDVQKASLLGVDTILVRKETSPEDIVGMNYANGILTQRGGTTSHAAVVARSMGKCCITGCEEITINEKQKTLSFNKITLKEGDYISLDGTTGYIYNGKIKANKFYESKDLHTFMSYVNEVKAIKVYANADTEKEAITAFNAGADGIGLCRTEHMFFDEKRILAFREMICSNEEKSKDKAISKLLKYQVSDFEKIFIAASGKDVTIRLLDPPLHEFLPSKIDEIEALALSLNISKKELNNIISSLKEFNPMLGQRGCRLLIKYPKIAIMQTNAIITAGINLIEKSIKSKINIMIPLICSKEEFDYLKEIIDNEADKIMKQRNIKINYSLGSMIEVPRAALLTDKITTSCDFFSYGTNDLTQMTYGFSRDDSVKYINDYYDKKIFDIDPFTNFDTKGVGKLVEHSIDAARSVKNDISLGVCGEQATSEEGIKFFMENKVDYISCSPYKIYIVKLLSAQEKLKNI